MNVLFVENQCLAIKLLHTYTNISQYTVDLI